MVEQYRWWFIARGGYINAQDALADIKKAWPAVKCVKAVGSELHVERKFDNLVEAKKFDKDFTNWCWESAGLWHEQEDVDVAGIQEFKDDEWQELEEDA